MALTCNIDSRGRRLRLISGLVVLTIGILLALVWALPSPTFVRWLIALAAIAGGVFQIFEARAGWCAVRAMGFRTRV